MGNKGKYVPIHWTRQFIADLVFHAKKAPLCTIEREMRLHSLEAVRSRVPQRVGWSSIFFKAMALASKEFPELRQSWVPYPFPRIYEHPDSLGSIAINRTADGKEAVLFGLINNPESISLVELTKKISGMKSELMESNRVFYRSRRISRLPSPIRNFMWNYALYFSGYSKAKNFGTFGVSSVSCFQANTLELLTPLTSSLNYGPVGGERGTICRLTFDHRVLDGSQVARILGFIEEVINFPFLKELNSQFVTNAA